jgi:hypothetical protein
MKRLKRCLKWAAMAAAAVVLLKKSDRGWTVYSVGRDLKDDGGHIDDPVEPPDYGFGPPGDEPRPSEPSSPESW